MAADIFRREHIGEGSAKQYHILELRHEGDLWNIMPNNSTTVNLIMLQGLAMVVANKMNLEIGQFKRNHPGGQIGRRLEK